ncbi:MAG: molybdopterin cofactor-binding domain-containing protein [Bacteroidota bacterium]
MHTPSHKNQIFKVDRRDFLKTAAWSTGGLLLGVQLGCDPKPKFLTGNPAANFAPNLFISINGSGEVSLIAHRSEMGTGIRTSLPLVMADEMEADWEQVSIVQAVGDKQYGDQNTDGSYSIRMFYPQLRKAGATVRLMLEQIAAREWGVDVSECTADNHRVVHTSGKVFGYGYLAEKAGDLPIPDESQIRLKSPEEFRYITKKTSIYDLEDIVTGKATFGFDTQIPGAKVAVIARNPETGAGIESYDDTEAMKIPGVQKVFQIDAPGFPTGHDAPMGGVVVIADDTWTALKGKEALQVSWAKGKNARYDSVAYLKQLQNKSKRNGQIKREQGAIKSALKSSEKVIESDYLVPHFVHSPMETPSAVAHYKEDNTCELWAPVQDPQWTRRAVAGALGIDEGRVRVNVSLLGGAFGRKSKPDFAVEAALASREAGAPVKLLWTREEDIQNGFYHFLCAQHMKVGIDENNQVNAWLHRSLFPPIGGTASAENKIASNLELCMGALDMPFNIENVCCETNEAPAQIRIGWLRSVGNINHGFAIGSMLDKIAETRGMDPIDNILDLIGEDREIDFDALVDGFWNYNEKVADFPWSTSRFKHVIQTVKEQSGWGKQLGARKGMGFAAHRSFLTYVACVVEVEVDTNNNIHIPMAHYAVDCGVPVNPERIKAQFEGGAAFGASLALKSEITVKDGAVQQNNFHDYLVARITDAPYETAVHIIESNEKPTGVGEPPVPPFIPALCNAIYQATGTRITQLPVKLT